MVKGCQSEEEGHDFLEGTPFLGDKTISSFTKDTSLRFRGGGLLVVDDLITWNIEGLLPVF